MDKQDVFSDRLTLLLIHLAFFFKVFKNEKNKVVLQEIYDFIFRQLELSIREIGYGDQSINKKMKTYLNFFHSIIDKIHFWDDLLKKEKANTLKSFILNHKNIEFLLDYFENYIKKLKKNTLNSYVKSVSNR